MLTASFHRFILPDPKNLVSVKILKENLHSIECTHQKILPESLDEEHVWNPETYQDSPTSPETSLSISHSLSAAIAHSSASFPAGACFASVRTLYT